MRRHDEMSAALAYTAAAVLLWPVIELLGRQLGGRHDAVQVVWLRYAVHVMLLVAYFGTRGQWDAFATRRPLLQFARGLCMFGMPICFLLAAQRASTSWVWSVFWLAPLLVLLAAPLLGERPRALHFVAAAVAWVGALAILRPNAAGSPAALLLALGMAATFGGYLLTSRTLAGESIAASLFFTGVGALLPMTLLAMRVWRPLAPVDAVPAIALGLSSLAFLYTLDRALELAPAIHIVPALVAVVAWEALLHGGVPDGTALGGMAMIAGGILVLGASYRTAARPALRQDVR